MLAPLVQSADPAACVFLMAFCCSVPIVDFITDSHRSGQHSDA